MTHYTRAQWRARASRGGPGYLSPSRVVGIALHWPAMSRPVRGVAAVMAALRSWQNYHMDTHGWSDIGYQVAIDQDGNRYDLRGLRVQSGANGNTTLNQQFGAVLLILAPGEHPTEAMTNEVRAVITEHRELFPNSTRVVGHGDIRPGGTACPGPITQGLIDAGAFEPRRAAPATPGVDRFVEAETLPKRRRIAKRLTKRGGTKRIRRRMRRWLRRDSKRSLWDRLTRKTYRTIKRDR